VINGRFRRKADIDRRCFTYQPDDPEQSKRFLEAAKESGADETEKGAERAFKAVVKPRKTGGK
jgi:hypothetical protein